MSDLIDEKFICGDGGHCGVGGYCDSCPHLDKAIIGYAETLEEGGNARPPKMKRHALLSKLKGSV